MDLIKASFKEISSSIKSKKVSAVEVTRFFLDRIEKHNSKVNAFVAINDSAIQQAQKIDELVQQGSVHGTMLGVPVGIKDMFCTKGLKTTAASKILQNFVPPYDATVVSKIKNQGAIVLGKLNQDEFAMGSSNESSCFGTVKNPWDLKYVAGGSSGGSAAAQSLRLCAGSTGTDTGGSIRQPASFCGIVGVKPTYGRVSRYGIIAYASSLDQAGPMVNCVDDAAIFLEAICGKDDFDGTTSSKKVPNFSENLNENIKGLKVGILKENNLSDGLDADVQKAFIDAKEALRKLGAEIVEISVPLVEKAIPVYYLIASSEASSNLSRYDGVKYGHRAAFESLAHVGLDEFYSKTRSEGFGSEVKRRIMLGTYCLSSGYYDAYYNKACQVRRLIHDQFIEAFKKCDVILSPVTTTPAFKIGEKITDPLAMYLNDLYTVSTNLAGLPGMSIPFSKSNKGLPIGVQIIAKHFEEQTMLNVGYALEKISTETWGVPNV